MSYPHEEKDQLLLATGGYDHTIKIWLADTGKCVRTISHSDSVSQCVYNIVNVTD